jgi:hypothetical protein
MSEATSNSVACGMRRLRRAVAITRRNAIFVVAFFGSLAWLVQARPDERIFVWWLLSFIIWAAIIRWWIVAGTLAGLFFYQPQLHNVDVEGHVLHVVFGGLIGVCFEALHWGIFGED